jgi:hypothetical protein
MGMYHWGTIRQANAELPDWFLQRLVFPNPPPAFAPIQAHVKALGGSVPAYNLAVGEIDSLVKAICKAANINAKVFTMDYQEPGRTYLRHENAEASALTFLAKKKLRERMRRK